MTKDEIAIAMDPNYPNVYIQQKAYAKLTFVKGSTKIGSFYYTDLSDLLEKENKYTFLENENIQKYTNTKEENYITVIDGNLLISVEYPIFL